MTIPHPRRPEPLPSRWLSQRGRSERKWELNSRASEADLLTIQAWAKDALANIFIAQDMGGNHNDPQFIERLDDLYDSIRHALTRQDLILGFLLVVQQEAQQEADDRLREFRRELKQLTDPDVF